MQKMIVRELFFSLGLDTKKAQKNATRMDKVVVGLRRNIVRLGAAAVTSAVALGAAALNAGNDYQSMANKLKLVTDGTKELESAQQGVFNIAQKARTSLEASTDLYFGMQKAANKYGLSQERVLRITETTAKLATMAGNKDPAGTNAALFQLRQGIMSGQLRGQELNSVLEQATPVADAIAAGMGIPFEEIREKAMQGEITGIAVLKALESQAEVTDKEFAKMNRTAGQAAQQMKNAFGFYAGRMAQDTDVIESQVAFFDAIREIISSNSFKSSLVFALDTMSAIIRAITKVAEAMGTLIDKSGGLREILKSLTAAFLALTTIMLARAAPVIGLWIWYLSGLAVNAYIAAGGFWALAAGVLAATWPILAIIAAGGVLFLLFQDILTLLEGGDSIIGRFWESIKNWASGFMNWIQPLVNLLGSLKEKMAGFGNSKINPKNWFGDDDEMQQNAAGKIVAGSNLHQSNVFSPQVSITVPPGTMAEQVDYMDNRFKKIMENQNKTQLREARNNFPEVE